ncbi:class I SAM-dependent methyltransferase [Kitasatospora sp. NPDC002040]|uniref:class I SAM-dependent methyltransferase n=1 Tax=Kitasatospora sp. NPDC002040 TaxID=3154661 RepID=UPI00332C1257
MTTASDVEIQADTLAGYADASRLRQVLDRDWVLDQVTGTPETLVDLGSGIGQLLETALDRHPSLRLAIGLERSEHRIAEATERLARFGGRTELHRADLTDPQQLPLTADLVTMTSVLHWLYPVEDRIFSWVAERLAPGGTFLLTTYHPARDAFGLGGEDELVRSALIATGVEPADVPGVFERGEVLPIGTRTRPADELGELLARYFTVDSYLERDAVVNVEDAAQYEHFHAATFGDYYSRLVPPELRATFFRAIGETARQRQDELGWVSHMPVRLWQLKPL